MTGTIEEKQKTARRLDGDALLGAYNWHCRNFCFTDKDFIENYEIIKFEVLRRLNEDVKESEV